MNQYSPGGNYDPVCLLATFYKLKFNMFLCVNVCKYGATRAESALKAL